MAKYTNEYSKLPYQIMEVHGYKDVDNGIANLINEIKRLQSIGLYDEANKYVEYNKNVLGKYVFSVEAFNAIEEETRNLEIMTLENKQSVYYNEVPGNLILNDVWISQEVIETI